MSRLFVILMIVLLPLRGWAGDLMSVQMATGHGVSSVAGAMPADCPMHAAAKAPGADADRSALPSGMTDCGTCDLCLPIAELAAPPVVVSGPAAHAQPTACAVGFDSVPPAPRLKPPIS